MYKRRKTFKRHTTTPSRTFTEKDYNSNDGMLTMVWGSSMWHVLHTMSFNYPLQPTEEQKKHYSDFVKSLENVLPCGKCRKNLRTNFNKLPLTIERMENRETFSRYIYELHELVNTMLHKKSGLTYEDVRERYEHFRARCISEENEPSIKTSGGKKENGCTEPLYGKKSRCILHIVPQTEKCNTFQIDERCIKKRELTNDL